MALVRASVSPLLLLLLAVFGCARPDWIESTLVTADVAGRWHGTASLRQREAPLALELQQSGPKVSGTFQMGRGAGFVALAGPARRDPHR